MYNKKLKDEIFVSEDLYIDMVREGIFLKSDDKKVINISGHRYLIIKCLCFHYNEFVKTEEIVKFVFGSNTGKKENITKTMSSFRQKLAEINQTYGSATDSFIIANNKGEFKIELSESPFEEENDIPECLTSPYEYCKSHEIIGFSNQSIDMCPYLKDKNNIYIVATTGAHLISTLIDNGFISSKLKDSTNFYILFANKNSEFANDVSEIEKADDNRCNDLSNEFEEVIMKLKRVIESEDTAAGKIYIGSGFSLIRQTITLGIDDNNNAWGWLTMTLPPKKAAVGTPSFAFKGDIKKNSSFAYSVYSHIQALIKEAQKRNSWIEVTQEINPKTFYFRSRYSNEQRPAIRKEWENKTNLAQLYMQSKQNNQDILIEVAAQHPLREGMPAYEFGKRLDFAFELYSKLKKELSERKVLVYVPGSIHVPDKLSLSNAGRKYLIQKGIPESDILGTNENVKYKGKECDYAQGVYNSADECYVASEIFKNGSYRQLCSVCSPNQMLRKQLFYIRFNVIPTFYTVPLDSSESASSSHDLLYELFEALPDVLYRDHDWQHKDSLDAIRTRKDRQPDEINFE